MICEEIFVVDATPTTKAKRHIDACISKGVCLCGCGKPAVRRGLANPCYYAFYRELGAMGKRAAARYLARLIRDGHVLASGEINKLKRRDNIFARAATEEANT